MDDDHRELLRRLFVAATALIETAHDAATALIETAHDAAIAGQSGEIAAGDYAEAARRVQARAQDVAALAEAAMIVANLGINQRRNRPKRSR